MLLKTNSRLIFSLVHDNKSLYTVKKGVTSQMLESVFNFDESCYIFNENFWDKEWEDCKKIGIQKYLEKHNVSIATILKYLNNYCHTIEPITEVVIYESN